MSCADLRNSFFFYSMVPEFLANLIAEDKAEYRRETIGFSQFYTLVVPDGKVIFITNIEISPFIELPEISEIPFQNYLQLLNASYANSMFQLRVYNQFLTFRYTYKPEIFTNFRTANDDSNNVVIGGFGITAKPSKFDTLIKCRKDTFFSVGTLEPQSNADVNTQNTIVNGLESDQPAPTGSYSSILQAIYNIQSGTGSAYNPMTDKYSLPGLTIVNSTNYFQINPDQAAYPFTPGLIATKTFEFLSLTHFLNIEFVAVNLAPGA